jgi:SAM-dependent methyltransferase
VPSQIVVDQDVLLRPSLVVDSCAKARRHATDLALQRIPRVAATRSRSRMIRNLKTATGIDYRAPLDARRTGLAASSVDLVTSNSTLEHVPRQELLPLMAECRRVLKDTGIVCVRVDYEDHFAGFDRDLSPYNFLRYSESEWRRFNSRLHYQNRLRHSDYVALFEEAGFSLLSVETLDPAPEAVGAAGRLGIHEEFRRYARADLLVRKGEFVLAKAGG